MFGGMTYKYLCWSCRSSCSSTIDISDIHQLQGSSSGWNLTDQCNANVLNCRKRLNPFDAMLENVSGWFSCKRCATSRVSVMPVVRTIYTYGRWQGWSYPIDFHLKIVNGKAKGFAHLGKVVSWSFSRCIISTRNIHEVKFVYENNFELKGWGLRSTALTHSWDRLVQRSRDGPLQKIVEVESAVNIFCLLV